MRNFLLAIVFAFITFAIIPTADADNETIFNEIRAELSELDSLLKIVSDNGIDIGWGYTLPLPGATRSEMITRMIELRTSIKNKLNQLTIE